MLIADLLFEYDAALSGAIGMRTFKHFEPRDIVLMVNDGLSNAEIGVELEIATPGISINVDSLPTQIKLIRAAVRRAMEIDGGLQYLATAMNVDVAELTTFMEVKGKQRVPSLRGQARRLIQSGVTSPQEIIRKLREWAALKNIPADQATLDQIVSIVRRKEFNLPKLKGGRKTYQPIPVE